MSNSVLFLLAAVGISVIGTLAVWLHGRPRRPRSSVDHFAKNLRALSMQRDAREQPSGITPLPPSQAPRRSPRPMRPSRESRPGT